MLPPEAGESLCRLLGYLDRVEPAPDNTWQGWEVVRLDGGANNRLFRARHACGEYVIKFCVRDERRRAEHEFRALTALKEAGLRIAPMPVLLDVEGYRLPVVVQTWLEGSGVQRPPRTEEEWEELLKHYQQVHSVTSSTCSPGPLKAYGARSVGEGRSLVSEQLARIPRASRPPALLSLVRRLEGTAFPSWTDAPVTLCRIDPNVSNFVRTVDGLASVDWEYGGWGDPAFDLADLMAHPTYLGVPPSRWAWLVEAYAEVAGDQAVAARTWAYLKILLVWWAVRLARVLYEAPLGLDRRLAPRPADWEVDAQARYTHYLRVAEGVQC